MITTIMLVVFVLGYLIIALEHNLKIDKTATSLLMCVLCWVLYMSNSAEYLSTIHPLEFNELVDKFSSPSELAAGVQNFISTNILLDHMGDTCEIVFFLMGAMSIVEIVDSNGGFNFVRRRLITTSKRTLLWRIVILSFFMSAVLDNLTTTIVMVMLINKLVPDKHERWIYASLVVLAANSGGAFSPIGDITTIMLWIKGNVSTLGIFKEVFIPSVVSVLVPALILQRKLKGTIEANIEDEMQTQAQILSANQSRLIFFIGVGGLITVPLFREFTGLPPFMGILLVFSVLWILTELLFRGKTHIRDHEKKRTSNLLHKIDLSTILFFLGILMAVAAIGETGTLVSIGTWLENVSNNNAYLVTGGIGVFSSIVDNVPLVASCMEMYPVADAAQLLANPDLANFAQDGVFWQLLAYCAGVGGSLLIIGSAAGVIAMGIEKITFGWYLKHITWVAALGYLSGILVYWLMRVLIFS